MNHRRTRSGPKCGGGWFASGGALSACMDERVLKPQDFGLALVCLVALMLWKQPPWLVVVGGGVAGWLLSVAL